MTYKENFIKKLTNHIIKLDKNNNMIKSNYLRDIRRKAVKLHGNHFIPKRFISPELKSIKLACPEFFL